MIQTYNDSPLYSIFIIALLCLYLLLIVYCIVGLVFSVLSILDVADRSKTELPDKTMWILLIYPFGSMLLYIPTFIYFFKKKKELDKAKKN